MNAQGPVFKYGDNIDTDVIIPARYLNTQSEAELASHCMEDIDKTFVTRVKAGDIMVGGENFGCGSSREHAPVAIKASGISCVIAKSFARIFYRNAINIGLPILECPAASEAIAEGDTVSNRLRHRRHHRRDDGPDLPGRPVPAVHPEHHRQGRPDEQLEGLMPCRGRACPARGFTAKVL